MRVRSSLWLGAGLAATCLAAAGCGTVTSSGPAGSASSSTTASASTAASASASASASAAASPSTSASASASASPSTSASAPAAVAGCQASQLKVTLVTSGVATGNVGAVIGFTNQGTAPCQLSGWPNVAGVTAAGATASAAGHILTTMFGPIGLTSPPTVVIAPGKRAEAVVEASDQPATGSTCPPAYHQLKIGAPGMPGTNTIDAMLSAINHYLPACVPIKVTPVVAASAVSLH